MGTVNTVNSTDPLFQFIIKMKSFKFLVFFLLLATVSSASLNSLHEEEGDEVVAKEKEVDLDQEELEEVEDLDQEELEEVKDLEEENLEDGDLEEEEEDEEISALEEEDDYYDDEYDYAYEDY